MKEKLEDEYDNLDVGGVMHMDCNSYTKRLFVPLLALVMLIAVFVFVKLGVIGPSYVKRDIAIASDLQFIKDNLIISQARVEENLFEMSAEIKRIREENAAALAEFESRLASIEKVVTNDQPR